MVREMPFFGHTWSLRVGSLLPWCFGAQKHLLCLFFFAAFWLLLRAEAGLVQCPVWSLDFDERQQKYPVATKKRITTIFFRG